MKRLFLGTTIVFFGICLLLASLDLYNMGALLATWWPLFFVILGILSLSSDSKSYVWPVVLMLIGFGILFDNLAVMTIEIEKVIFPMIVVSIGVMIMLKSVQRPQRPVEKSEESISVFMAGAEQANNSRNYKGGKLTAVCGGIELDLSRAKVVDGAVIDVLVLMGGIELRVPENVIVKNRAICMLGGIENKQRTAGEKAPTLYIDGTLALGGLEVKR